MAKNGNGTLGLILRISAILLTILAMGAGVVAKFTRVDDHVAHNKESITAIKEGVEKHIWPEVKANSDHRKADELNQKYMEQRFDRLEKGLSDFTVEQRAVNKQLLHRLPE